MLLLYGNLYLLLTPNYNKSLSKNYQIKDLYPVKMGVLINEITPSEDTLWYSIRTISLVPFALSSCLGTYRVTCGPTIGQ